MLFNSEMVLAILDGRKTQTRRPMKIQPRHGLYGNGNIISPEYFVLDYKDGTIPLTKSCAYRWLNVCPFGKVGDRIYVRETFMQPENIIFYKADEADLVPYEGLKWTPSIHMPRWASRITLEITNVRVERVQDISEEDAIAEGSFLRRCSCPQMNRPPRDNIDMMFKQTGCHIHGEEFQHLWNSIYNNWDDNPWVWVAEFKVVEGK